MQIRKSPILLLLTSILGCSLGVIALLAAIKAFEEQVSAETSNEETVEAMFSDEGVVYGSFTFYRKPQAVKETKLWIAQIERSDGAVLSIVTTEDWSPPSSQPICIKSVMLEHMGNIGYSTLYTPTPCPPPDSSGD